jgi:hypothetical protein
MWLDDPDGFSRTQGVSRAHAQRYRRTFKGQK